ncbi:MAG: hypothetical protein HN435_18455 [Nitrospinaceae bacterium]|jgi:putative tricarboxylic transport membrane protein|nr:hypothetical protein [Nitrospinaceae bacterium]MBT3820683.1 hypothetical protein [Nitrospinaceae bacterium]
MRTLGIPDAPLVITFLITPMMEGSLRRALLINQGSWFDALFKSPLAIGLFLAAVILTYLSVRLQVMEKLSTSASEMDEE